MRRLVWGQMRYRPRRALALGMGVLVAAVSFTLLASTARTTELRVRGSVESNFRNAYDILVRPNGSFTEIENREGLVRENYLSGIFGGISSDQYARIRGIPNVEVAAPIANVGFFLPLAFIPVGLDNVVTEDPTQIYRLRQTFHAQRGLSRYPDDASYVYYARAHEFSDRSELVPGRGAFEVCGGFAQGKPYEVGPFANASSLRCFSARSPGEGSDDYNYLGRTPPGHVTADAGIYFPILIAAVDPLEEARLVAFDRTVVQGRYLRSGERAQAMPVEGLSTRMRLAPALASTRAYVDETLVIDIERLTVPEGTRTPEKLASRAAYGFLRSLPGRVVERRTFSAKEIYEQLLRHPEISARGQPVLSTQIYWTTSPTRYAGSAEEGLVPHRVANPPEVWSSPIHPANGGFVPAPPANEDVQFRQLRPASGSSLIDAGDLLRTPGFRIVGRYDPARLPGFSPLSRLPMETYYPPLLEPADEESEHELGGRPLQPTQNVGDYVQEPPLLVTTLDAIQPFLSQVNFTGVRGRKDAPISVIRVRVAGVKGPDRQSQAQIRAVAIAIREDTGLDVDITAGSSPRPLPVELPAGKFGRPPLSLEEGWVKKGVSVSFLRALDDRRVGLFALILLTCGLFLGNAAFASIRVRRRELGTLLCLGWPQQAIFRIVLAELAAIGLLAGLAGAALAAALVPAFSLSVPIAQTLLVVPIALLVTILAGLVPAWRAARVTPLDAVLPVVAAPLQRRRVHSLLALALVNLRRLPARTLVGVLGLFVGVAALTVLLGIQRAFEGRLVGTLLGEAIVFDIRGVDVAAIALTVGLAALSLADVVMLNLRERAPELVTLRALGWNDQTMRVLVALEAVGLGLLGGLAGASAGVVAGAVFLGVPVSALLVAAALAAAGGVAVALVSSLGPLVWIARLAPTAALAEE